MTIRLGDLQPTEALSPDTATRLVFHDGPLELGWVHCGTTAEYLGTFYAGLAERASFDANEARHGIGYLTNELLENAIKFRAPGPVVVESALTDGVFELRVSNFVPEATSRRFQAILGEIVERDAGELLLERIEANAADAESSGSGLGLLTLISDYGVRLGWRFEPAAPGEPLLVATYAALTLT